MVSDAFQANVEVCAVSRRPVYELTQAASEPHQWATARCAWTNGIASGFRDQRSRSCRADPDQNTVLAWELWAAGRAADFRVAVCPDRFGHNVIAIPTKKTMISTKNKTDSFSQEMIGTAKASAAPKKQIGSNDKLSPARNVPSASNSKRTRLVAGVGMNCWTPDNSMMFMTTKTAALNMALDLIRGAKINPAFPPNPKSATLPN
jgi:hypothetical protein